MIGEHLVAARTFDHRGERQRSGDLDLERPDVTCSQLFGGVEVLRQQRARPAQVRAFARAESPAVGLQVGFDALEHRQTATDHPGVHASRRELGDVRQRADLTEHDAERLGEVGAGHRADAGGATHAVTRRSVRLIVAEPTTRVPS